MKLQLPCPVAAAKTSGLVGDHCTWNTQESETRRESSGLGCSKEWMWARPSVPALTIRFLWTWKSAIQTSSVMNPFVLPVKCSPVERGAVDGVHWATARLEREDCRGFQHHTFTLRGHCSWHLGGEGASEQQATLRANHESVGVPRRQRQGGDAHSVAATGLNTTQDYTSLQEQ